MKRLTEEPRQYLDELRKRSRQSRAFKSYQLVGLEVAVILEDFKNKSLYIKLAKEHGEEKLRRLAKSVAENKQVRNKGAYFMRLLHS